MISPVSDRSGLRKSRRFSKRFFMSSNERLLHPFIYSSLPAGLEKWMFSVVNVFSPFWHVPQRNRPVLTEISGFGTNPGSLRMFMHVPRGLRENAPLVVVLHGAVQTADDYAYGSGWVTLADRHKFALLFPQQRRSNNLLSCFHWYRRRDTERGQGEARSISQMIERISADLRTDRRSIFITGLSAGGAMTNVMLAAYPEIFAAGGIIAGLPYGVANNIDEALDCMSPGRARSAEDLGDRVRAASSHGAQWPRISVWHGDADTTVASINCGETVKQWLNVHGLPSRPTFTEDTNGCRRQVWCDAAGEGQIERYDVAGMSHGTPLEPGEKDSQCGSSGSYFYDVGVSSSWLLAKFWGLLDDYRHAPHPSARVAEGQT
jgi:feruloyl esterase